MPENHNVSIIIASYNYEEYIKEAIHSVIAQTHKNWELIIVDDGSADDSVSIINEYTAKHENIHLFQHPNQENKGLNQTIKLALEKSTGDYIAFLESDDYWDKTYLSKKIEILKRYPNTKLIFNDIETFGDSNSINLLNNHLKRCREIYRGLETPADISKYILSVNLIPTFSCWMVEKKALEECDFNPPTKQYLDLWLWAQIACRNETVCIDEKLTFWRLHKNSYIARTRDKTEIKDSKDFFKKLLKLLEKKNPKQYQTFLTKSLVYKLIESKNDALKTKKQNFLNSIKDKNIYLYGAGLFAKEVIESNDFSNINLLGIIDGDINKKGQIIGNYKIFHKNEIKNLKADVILLCVAEPKLLYYDLIGELLAQGLKTQVIADFFEAPKNKDSITSDSTIEDILLSIL